MAAPSLLSKATGSLLQSADCPIVVIRDTLQYSGYAVYRHLLSKFVKHAATNNQTLFYLSLERSGVEAVAPLLHADAKARPATATATVTSTAGSAPPLPPPTAVATPRCVLFDGYSDPAGWRAAAAANASASAGDSKSKPATASAAGAAPSPFAATHVLTNVSNLSAVSKAILSAAATAKPAVGTTIPLFIDSIACLLLRQSSVAAVSQFLVGLAARGIGPIVTVLHSDMLDADSASDTVAKLEYIAHTTCVTKDSVLSADAPFAVDVVYKRSSGKVSRSSEDVYPLLDGSVKGVSTAFDTKRAPTASAAATGGAAPIESAADPTANLPFNLRLTDKQKAARETVSLPYAHRGQGVTKTMFTVGDMKDGGGASAVVDDESSRGMGQATTSDGDDDEQHDDADD